MMTVLILYSHFVHMNDYTADANFSSFHFMQIRKLFYIVT